MTTPDGYVPPQKLSEPNPEAQMNKLAMLYQQNPGVFWFLDSLTFPRAIQYSATYDEDFFQYPALQPETVEHPIHMSLGMSTIGSDPETRLNEDSCFALDFSAPSHPRKLLAVIDGASSQMPIAALEPYGVSGAFYISHLIQFGFHRSQQYQELKNKPDINAKEIIAVINSWVKEQLSNLDGVDYNDTATIPGAAATIALVDFPRAEISLAHVADTIAVTAHTQNDYAGLQSNIASAEIHTNNLNRKFDDETNALVDQIMQEQGISRDIAAKDPRVKKQLRASFRRKINKEEGCGILNGMPELITNDLVLEKKINLIELAQQGKGLVLILASDGFYSVFPTSDSGDLDPIAIAEFGERFTGTKHSSAIEDVRLAFLNDPQFERKPRLKLVDDITLLRAGFGVDVYLPKV